MGSPHNYIYWGINTTFIKPRYHCRVFNPYLPWVQSTSHHPSKGEVTPAMANLVPNVGTMVCGYSATYIQQPPSSSFTISWYRVADWCPTSKVEWNLCYHPEKQCESIWHFPDAWLRQQSRNWLYYADFGWTLSMCTTCTNFICVTLKGGLCPNYHQGTSKSVVINPEYSLGEQQWKANHLRTIFPQRKLIPGGLRCLGMREVAPDTPEDPGGYAVQNSFMN